LLGAKPVVDLKPEGKAEVKIEAKPFNAEKYRQLLKMPSPKREKTPETKPKPDFIVNALKNIMPRPEKPEKPVGGIIGALKKAQEPKNNAAALYKKEA
jgi:hypothetical protein